MNRMHRSIARLMLALLVVGNLGVARRALGAPVEPMKEAARMQEVVPVAGAEQLHNPGMGIYFPGTLQQREMRAQDWYSTVIDIGYFRDDWAVLEPSRGDYQFARYFDPIFDLWVKKWHKRVAFRFMSSNMHSQRPFVTPQWVFEAGVPSVVHKGISVPQQTDPVFWDDKYLQIQEEFVAALGKYLEGRGGVEFVDVGGIGEWGEMHLSRWSSADLERTGYTPTRYVAAYRRLIDSYARAFPHTRVFLNVGDWDQINDYAAIRGLHFRQDGLNPAGPSSNVGKRFYGPYSRRGVICNYELYAGYEEMKQKGWDVRQTFDKGLEDPISYLHINLGGYDTLRQLPAEVQSAVHDAARRLGFRFSLTNLKCNRALRLRPNSNARLVLDQTWKNLGVAPCYSSYALQWTLSDARGRALFSALTYPRTPTTQWWPGQSVTLHDLLSIPPQVLEHASGPLHLAVQMLESQASPQPIQLALGQPDEQGRYALATLELARQTSAQPALAFEDSFETTAANTPASRWVGVNGVTAGISTQAHAGQRALHLAGAPTGPSWSYGGLSQAQPLQASSLYRLSCWMKVDSLSDLAHTPYLKLGVNDAGGKWINNFNTSHYDTARLGTWQHLSGLADVPADAARGDIVIEKGDLESKVSLSLYLDDVKLELLETP